MSILERFSTIIKANINDLLDRAEDPAKMMDQYMRQLMSDLADVKRETASVIAEESRIQRQLEEKRQESAKNADLARRALQLSNEDDARVFLAKKQELEKRIEELQKMYDVAHENSMRMRQVHDKLVSDAETLRQRREAIQSKMALARAQEKAANDCVGLSTIADAIGLGKPLLITRNPYHDDSYLNGARTVDTVEDWIKAIKEIIENTKSTTIENEVNMVTCYQKMKKEMGL